MVADIANKEEPKNGKGWLQNFDVNLKFKVFHLSHGSHGGGDQYGAAMLGCTPRETLTGFESDK